MLYNKLLAIRWIRLRVMSDDSDRKASLMSNPDITRNLNAAEVEFALEESPGPVTGELRRKRQLPCEKWRRKEFRTFSRIPPLIADRWILLRAIVSGIVTEDRGLYPFLMDALHYFPSFLIFLARFVIVPPFTRIRRLPAWVPVENWLKNGNERGIYLEIDGGKFNSIIENSRWYSRFLRAKSEFLAFLPIPPSLRLVHSGILSHFTLSSTRVSDICFTSEPYELYTSKIG